MVLAGTDSPLHGIVKSEVMYVTTKAEVGSQDRTVSDRVLERASLIGPTTWRWQPAESSDARARRSLDQLTRR